MEDGGSRSPSSILGLPSLGVLIAGYGHLGNLHGRRGNSSAHLEIVPDHFHFVYKHLFQVPGDRDALDGKRQLTVLDPDTSEAERE